MTKSMNNESTQNKKFKHLYKLTEVELNNLIYDYKVNHMSMPQLMTKYNLTKRIVSNYLRNNNVKIRNNSESHKKIVDDNKVRQILTLYREGNTLSHVSKVVGISRGVVYGVVCSNNINRHHGDYQKGKHLSDETKSKIGYANKGHKVSQNIVDNLINYVKTRDKEQIKKTYDKVYETKRKHNTFNTSKPEQELYEQLKSEYGSDDIITNYKDERYPYCCDFYIKSKDLFIELNAHWTHGGKPFDENDKECLDKLNVWLKKAQQSNFYKQAIYVWTDLDVRKQKCARENRLNYKTIY